jgi:hypothetical protein
VRAVDAGHLPAPRVPGTCLPMGELETGFASALEIIA